MTQTSGQNNIYSIFRDKLSLVKRARISTHEQRFMFFSVKDVNSGVIDDWIKLVQIKQWWRHDDKSCTVFN
jgi:hypothetical protein